MSKRTWRDAFNRVTEADRLDQLVAESYWRKRFADPIYEKIARGMIEQLAEVEDERIYQMLLRKLDPLRGQL